MTNSLLFRIAPRLVWAVCGGLLIACLLMHPLGEVVSAQAVSAAAVLAAAAAGWGCMAISGRAGTGGTIVRFGWSIAGSGAILLAISQSGYLLPELRAERWPIVETCAGIAYLAALPIMWLGLLLLASAYGKSSGLRPIADAASALGGLALASWYWVLRPIAAFLHGHPTSVLIATAGPLLDLTLTFTAFMLLYLPSAPRSARLLGAGLPMVALGDTLFALGTFHGITSLRSWSELAWTMGLALAALAPFETAQAAAEEESTAPASPDPWSWRATMGVIAVGAVTLASVSAVLMTEWRADHHGFQWQVVVVCFGLIAATLAHQVFSIVAHGNASSQLRGSNQRLEETVAERTRQLQVLHEIVRAATSSLHVDEVLGQILNRTSQALSADATAVWLLEEESGFPALHLHAQSGFDCPEHRALLSAIPPRWGRGLAAMLKERRCVPVSCEAPAAAPSGSRGVAASDPGAGARAEVWCAPLEWRGKALGVLGAARWQGSLGRTERGLLEAVALEVAAALQNARLYHLAVEAADHDGVTGLFNHRAIIQHVTARIREAASSGQPLAVILFDLDNFKRINDTHGHLVGDQILKCVGALLQESCPEGCLAGRYGGDEFVIVCPGADAAAARALTETLKSRLKQAAIDRPGGGALPISASIGVALYPEMASSQHELLALADMNLYESKAKGSGAIIGLDQPEEQEQLCAGSFSTLDALVTAVDRRDHYTRKHSEEVTEYSLMIARELGLSEETMRTLRIAGLLHDVGKLLIPDAVLRKPGALSDDEFEVMKQHPVYGWLIVSAIPSLAETLPAIRHHHERWDGRGYPDQLQGDDIPFLGRLMAVPDAFSAMTTDRPYRKGLSVSEAVQRLRDGAGTQFDERMVQAFIRALEAEVYPEDGGAALSPAAAAVWVG